MGHPLPLTDIKVVEFGQFIAGPGAVALLAALGADVVKVESLTGDATRHLGHAGQGMFRANNRGKRSISIDLASTQGAAIARDLVATADVLVHNMRPGSMERLGLGAEQLTARDPRLIYARVSGFGTASPSSGRPGFDIAAQAESGMMSFNADANGEARKIAFAVVDQTAAHSLAQAVLAALFNRERRGRGEVIDVSLFHAAVHLQSSAWSDYFASGFASSGGDKPMAPAAEVIDTADGQIVLSAYTPLHWNKLCSLLSTDALGTDPRFATNELRVQNRPALRAVISEALKEKTTKECVDWLSGNGLVVGAICTVEEVPDCDHARYGQIFGTGPDVNGFTDRYVTSPYQLGGRPISSEQAPPVLGQHTIEILSQLGYDDQSICAIVEAGVAFDSTRSAIHAASRI